jgi:NAD+ kinase
MQDPKMAFPVRACALVGRFADLQVAEPLRVLVPHLRAREITVLVAAETPLPGAMDGVVRVPMAELARQADLVIAIGGDGTLLFAAGLVARHGVPLLGINRGRLGFLTDVMPAELVAEVDAALQGRLVADERPLTA